MSRTTRAVLAAASAVAVAALVVGCSSGGGTPASATDLQIGMTGLKGDAEFENEAAAIARVLPAAKKASMPKVVGFAICTSAVENTSMRPEAVMMPRIPASRAFMSGSKFRAICIAAFSGPLIA